MQSRKISLISFADLFLWQALDEWWMMRYDDEVWWWGMDDEVWWWGMMMRCDDEVGWWGIIGIYEWCFDRRRQRENAEREGQSRLNMYVFMRVACLIYKATPIALRLQSLWVELFAHNIQLLFLCGNLCWCIFSREFWKFSKRLLKFSSNMSTCSVPKCPNSQC